MDCGRDSPMNPVDAPVQVFVVDDDESVRRSLTRLLRAAGYEAMGFASAEAFLRCARLSSAPGCVLLDITMPHVNGLELMKRMQDVGVRMPVIAVSASDDKESRVVARRVGATLFLGKPVDDRALLDAIAWVTGAR
jgi:FixJ family two-component response regulator